MGSCCSVPEKKPAPPACCAGRSGGSGSADAAPKGDGFRWRLLVCLALVALIMAAAMHGHESGEHGAPLADAGRKAGLFQPHDRVEIGGGGAAQRQVVA